MLLSIIIPTCNRIEFLSKCLYMLKHGEQSADFNLYEVIVSDDSKTDTSFNFISKNYPWVKWFSGPKKGPAANRNNGAKHAISEWLIFMDDDCIPDKNLIKAYSDAIKQYKNVKVFEGYTNAERTQQNFLEESPINTTGGFLWSCNFMINNYLFNDVLKGFDEGYPYASMEDVDLQHRLKMINEPIQFIKNAIVMHPWRLQKKPFEIGNKRFSSMLYFINKFPEKKQDYNSRYYVRAFFSTAKGMANNSIRFRFRGFPKRVVVTFMQLYFAIRIKANN